MIKLFIIVAAFLVFFGFSRGELFANQPDNSANSKKFIFKKDNIASKNKDSQSKSQKKDSQSKSQEVVTTKITAKVIDIKRPSEEINFYHDVTVERGDVTIKAENMVVYYKEGQKEREGAIKKIIAKNNVKIFHQEFTASSDLGVYNPATDNLTLEKNVVFNNGLSVAKGENFVYNLATQKGRLFGDKKQKLQNSNDGRVIVIIEDNPSKKESDD